MRFPLLNIFLLSCQQGLFFQKNILVFISLFSGHWFWTCPTWVAQQHRFVFLGGTWTKPAQSRAVEESREVPVILPQCSPSAELAGSLPGIMGLAPPRALHGLSTLCMSCLVRVSPHGCNWEFRHKTQLLFDCTLHILSAFHGSIKGTVQCLPSKCLSGTACAVTGAQWMMAPGSKHLKGFNDTATARAKCWTRQAL